MMKTTTMTERLLLAAMVVGVTAAVAAGVAAVSAANEEWAAALVVTFGIVGWTAAWLAASHLPSILPARTGPMLDLVLVVSSFSMLALTAGTAWLITAQLL